MVKGELFENVPPIADIMLDNGLALALCSLLSAVNSDVAKRLKLSEKQVYVVLFDLFIYG